MDEKKNPEILHSIIQFDAAIRDFPESKPEEIFRAPEKGDVAERFSIYGTGYGARTRESMEEVYEVLSKVIGEENWLRLGGLYTKAYPSRSYNLADVGICLPQFLRENKYEVSWCDLAELELLVWKSFHARRGGHLTLEDFSKISDDTRFKFQPSTFLFSSDFSVASVWNERSLTEIGDKPECAVVHRTDFIVKVAQVSSLEFDLLQNLQMNFSLGESLENIDFDLSDQTLVEWLRSWHERNYFISLRRDS